MEYFQAMVFVLCNNLRIMGLTHINSPKFHLAIVKSNNADISKLQIFAPSNSPNTDGIDLLFSTNIKIRNCRIGTGKIQLFSVKLFSIGILY